MTGLLDPKSSEFFLIIGHFFVLLMILVVYLGHGIVLHPVAVLFFSKSVFWERSYAPELRKNQKQKWYTSIV